MVKDRILKKMSRQERRERIEKSAVGNKQSARKYGHTVKSPP
jgi:hypothetical protein